MKELNLFCLIFNTVLVFCCAITLPNIYKRSRKPYLFGVTIPQGNLQDPEAESLRKNYSLIVRRCLVMIVMLNIFQFAMVPDLSLLVSIYLPFLILAVHLYAFISNVKKVLRLKKTHIWQTPATVSNKTSTSFSQGDISEIPWLLYLAGLIIVFIGFFIMLINYQTLPDMVPIHFGLNFAANNWARKSIFSVLGAHFLGLFLYIFLFTRGVLINNEKLPIAPQAQSLSLAQHRHYRKYMGLWFGLLTLGIAIILLFLCLLVVWPIFRNPFWWIFILFLLTPAIPISLLSYRAGQDGSRLKIENFVDARGDHPPEQGFAFDRKDDKYWLLGVFYHNPDDKARTVESRLTGGWSFNYAQPIVRVGMGIAVLLFLSGYVWLTIWLCSILL